MEPAFITPWNNVYSIYKISLSLSARARVLRSITSLGFYDCTGGREEARPSSDVGNLTQGERIKVSGSGFSPPRTRNLSRFRPAVSRDLLSRFARIVISRVRES